MIVAALDRRAPSKRLGMKILSALLTLACALSLLVAVERLRPPSEWRAAPSSQIDVRDWASRLREAVWPEPVLRADPADALLTGRFAAAGDAAELTALTFDGALIRIEGGQTLRTRPWRIAEGRERYAAGRSFAQALAAADDAQIELREVVPMNDDTPAPSLAACGGRAPGLAALLHRGGRIDVMLFRQGATPGPDGSADAVCAVWSLARG